MIRRVQHTAAVILAVAGMAFAVVAPAAASAAPAGAATASSSGGGAEPDFTCPGGAICTFYGEHHNNSAHVWWPGRRGTRWYNFHKLHVDNPGSLRNNAQVSVWIDTQAGGSGGDPKCWAPGTAPGNLHHKFGWFYITTRPNCLIVPPKARA